MDASAPTEGRLTLGDATPWLGTLVRADLARVDKGSPQEQATLRQYKDAVASFGRKYPGSLPLAGFLIELARLESFEGGAKQAGRTPLQDASLADFEAAIQIFVRQRGSLGPSADLIQPYFDILIQRINATSGGDPADVSHPYFWAPFVIVGDGDRLMPSV